IRDHHRNLDLHTDPHADFDANSYIDRHAHENFAANQDGDDYQNTNSDAHSDSYGTPHLDANRYPNPHPDEHSEAEVARALQAPVEKSKVEKSKAACRQVPFGLFDLRLFDARRMLAGPRLCFARTYGPQGTVCTGSVLVPVLLGLACTPLIM